MCQVVILGAGPYGLAAAAHLDAAGIETRIFGEPMEFWNRNMPRGMFLRSRPECSEIGDPRRELTLDYYHARTGTLGKKPLPIEDFIDYGRWFQRERVPNLDRRRITQVRRGPTGFRLCVEDGEWLDARRLVVAAGIGPFAWRPPAFRGLPATLVSHSFEHADFGRFRGRSVVVVGGGQSALESAAILWEAGAQVEVVVRAPSIHWLGPSKPVGDGLADGIRRLLRALARPRFDIMGPRFVSWLLAWPQLFRAAPLALQRYLTSSAIRPAGAAWLVDRLADVRLTIGRAITAATPHQEVIRLRLDDGSQREIDHLLLATGYRVNVRRYPFLSPEIRAAVAIRNGYPDLEPGFESSVPGLHFIGTPAAQTFGPVFRFVVGTSLSGRILARHVVDRARRGPSRASAPSAPQYAS